MSLQYRYSKKKKKHLQVQEVSHFKQNHILAAVLCINHYLLNQWKAAFGPLPTFHPRSERKRTHTSLKQLRNSTTHITGDSHNPCGLVKWKVASDDVTRKRNKVGWRKAGKMTHTHTHTPTQCHHFLKNLTHTADKRRCSLDSVALVCWAILLAMPRTFSWLCVRFVRTEVYSGTLLRFSPSAVSAQTDAGLAVKILPGRLIFGALMQLCSWKHEHKTIDSTAFSFAKMPSFVTLFTVTWQLVHTEPFFKSS